MIGGWGSLPLDEALLDRLPNLRLLIYGAGSAKHLMTPAALSRGIRLTTAVSVNAQPVAEYCLGIILTALKRVFSFREAFLNGDPQQIWWGDRPKFDGGYYQKKIGLVGLGEISKYLARLLKAFDFEVFVCSGYLTPEIAQELDVQAADLSWIMANCDLVSIHSADTPRNRDLINRENLALLRPGSAFLNTARGAVVNEPALIERLEQGDIWAFLDVTLEEPPAKGHPFYTLPNCVLTPHISGSIGTETFRLGDFCLLELKNYFSQRPLQGEIAKEMIATRA